MSAGGKAFGLLKAQQRDRLEEINKVGHSLCRSVSLLYSPLPVSSVSAAVQFTILGLEPVELK